MSAFRGIGQSTRGELDLGARAAAAHQQERRPISSGRLGSGTLACSRCDAPVAIGPSPLLLTDRLMCPFCHHRGRVRDFLSLALPTRPARVEVRVRFDRERGGRIKPRA